MLSLGRSFPGCRPFANEEVFFVDETLAAATTLLGPRGNASRARLAQIKRGSTLAEVASSRTSRFGKTVSNGPARRRASLAQDKKAIKKVSAACCTRPRLYNI